MECGVDIILGGHAHVAQPMEKYIYRDPFTNESREGFIIYSLGDFISYHRHAKNTKLSWIISLTISKGILNGKGTALVSGLKILPIYIYTGFRDGICKEFKLLRFKNLLNQLDDGVNTYGFTQSDIEEFKRLEKHLYGYLLPKKHDNLLAE
jgi:poly-gamma-glutamate synthesis protein (capsule biosynthesis protein)